MSDILKDTSKTYCWTPISNIVLGMHSNRFETLSQISRVVVITLKDTNTNFDLAVSWCVNTNKSLADVHRFSLLQLALSQISICFP